MNDANKSGLLQQGVTYRNRRGRDVTIRRVEETHAVGTNGINYFNDARKMSQVGMYCGMQDDPTYQEHLVLNEDS